MTVHAKNILLIAGLGERYYFDPFLDACSSVNINIHICDPSRYPIEASVCAVQDNLGSIDGYIDTVQLQDGIVEKSQISLLDIDTAWYLRENYTRNSEEPPVTMESRFIVNESRQALRAIFSVLQCQWINSQESIERVSSNKLYQQLIASRCGLRVPQTIISNNAMRVQNFSDSSDGLLVKSIGYTRLDNDGRLALYSEFFSHEEVLSSHSSITVCPLYGQEYVEKLYEYRVMVIGSRVLACRIDSQASSKTKIDWRHYDLDNVEHKDVDLPEDVQCKLLNFMGMAGLRYGAIDMIETPDHDFVFLEVNPSGQWGWIADLAGLPIPEAVAKMLVKF